MLNLPAEAKRQAAPSDELARAYALIQDAAILQGRDYQKSSQRDRCLRQLITEYGLTYIQNIADEIRMAEGLPPKLQTNRIVENDEFRARLLDGEYRQKFAATTPDQQKTTDSKFLARSLAEYTAKSYSVNGTCISKML